MKKLLTISALALFCFGLISGIYLYSLIRPVTADALRMDEQELTIRAIKKTMPSVVSIVVSDLQDSTLITASGEIKQMNARVVKGSGTGFIISADGYILTNKHIVQAANTKTAEYKVTLSNNQKTYSAQVIGVDPINDLAVIRIFDKKLPYLVMGKSFDLPVGTTVLAIGNVLGRYSNTVTKGIVGGMGRSIIAFDKDGVAENLDNMIQTDAQINVGNSGGPLINLQGEVVGINVAMDQEGQAIGFAIPIDDAKPVIDSAIKYGRIIRARLGLRYIMINPRLVEQRQLKLTSGGLVTKGDKGEPAVTPGSPAARADIREADVITEINGTKVDGSNTVLYLVQKMSPGSKLKLKINRADQVIEKELVLDEFKP